MGHVSSAMQGFIGATQHLVQTLVGDDDVVYRQQVPADRWYYDYKGDFTTTKQELEARGWAIFYTVEGLARTVVEAVRIFFAKYVANTTEDLERSETILQTQIQSLKYTSWAILDPVGQKKTTVEEFAKGRFSVGCAKDAFNWGDKYRGTLTIPINFDYNWHPN